ncbi:hypothetical protein BDF20DRAFT_838375 [Mycotypha africana]|uniref:uncharacterized protein n=1 Tax=Mycotypha africana TaxID=64632 RepID=UPI0023007DED|nr:uncharacterized protein BDF20DRAFT_838375 [Mycotypha africana]KAI8969959.1 hypothetical protein BDF20DRAFT_838375 [Mycotypha africana]
MHFISKDQGYLLLYIKVLFGNNKPFRHIDLYITLAESCIIRISKAVGLPEQSVEHVQHLYLVFYQNSFRTLEHRGSEKTKQVYVIYRIHIRRGGRMGPVPDANTVDPLHSIEVMLCSTAFLINIQRIGEIVMCLTVFVIFIRPSLISIIFFASSKCLSIECNGRRWIIMRASKII